MNPSSSSVAATHPPAGQSVAAREVRTTTLLVTGALLTGVLLQIWVPPGALTLVAASGLAGLVVLVLAFAAPGRLRETMSGFRFTSTLLVALAIFAVLGTLVLQGKPSEFYRMRYGGVAGLLLALRLDDIFHGLPFAGLMALFGAAVVASATLRWPVKARNAGFFICHVGLLTSLFGAAASAALSVRGRIDLHAGGQTARHVRVTKAGMDTGTSKALGFDLRLDQFDLVNYETEYRVGYYEQVAVQDEHGSHAQWKLKASFDPDLAKHRLPGGDSFTLKGVFPDYTPEPRLVPAAGGGEPAITYTASQEWKHPAVLLEAHQGGLPREQLLHAERPAGFFLSPTRALVFEKREKEVKAFLSHVTAAKGSDVERATVAVNDPMTFAGWTLYQVNFNPEDPTYSGLEAVYDPGVSWVFLGFFLISCGVFYMFYVEPRLKAAAKQQAAAPAQA